MAKLGEYQVRLGDNCVTGYCPTKAEAVEQASKAARTAALEGWNTDSSWYVGIVIWVGSTTKRTQHQMGDGTGRWEWGTDKYDVVVTSTVAFGKATYEYSRTPLLTGEAQGRMRA